MFPLVRVFYISFFVFVLNMNIIVEYHRLDGDPNGGGAPIADQIADLDQGNAPDENSLSLARCGTWFALSHLFCFFSQTHILIIFH